MITHKLFKAALFCLLIVMGADAAQPADQSADLSSLSDADIRGLTIRLERIGCYRNCPAYSVTIHGDGRVEYGGKGHVKEKGYKKGA